MRNSAGALPSRSDDLAQQLHAAADRLDAIPEALARSLSVTVGRHGRTEEALRELAEETARDAGCTAAVDIDGDLVSVTFQRVRPSR